MADALEYFFCTAQVTQKLGKSQSSSSISQSSVHGLAQRGVSTTTMGVGNDYNEDLLEAMASSGDGNYYYIESPEQLPNIFQMELQGLFSKLRLPI